MSRLSLTVALLVACGLVACSDDSSGGAQNGASPDTKPSGTAQEQKSNVDDPAIQAIDEFIASQSIDKSRSSWKTSLPKPPELPFDASKTYTWILDTNVGTMTLEFLPDEAPMHVSSAVYLTRLGFFDGLTFHRVIPNFMAQGGDPLGNGRGSPGYRFDGEFGGAARHDQPGILSQANAGPGTDGSQFFITFVPTPHLDGRHTIYGKLVDGTETLKEIESRRQPNSPHVREPLIIESARVEVD